MQIVLAVHHFPPQRVAGAQLRAYRLARWLVDAGHQIQVICVETIDDPDCGNSIKAIDDEYLGIPVQRLSFDLRSWPDPIRWSYDNPILLDFFRGYLSAHTPDLLHLISGYLLGTAPLKAAYELGLPTIVTLTDFWFLCRTIQLHRGDGSLCWGPDPAECTRCWLNRWRPFHWLETHLPRVSGLAGKLLQLEWLLPKGLQDVKRALSQRQAVLLDCLNRADRVLCITQFVADVHTSCGLRSDLPYVIPYRDPWGRKLTENHGFGHASSDIHFAFLGSVAPHKGVHVLIKAFGSLREREGATLTIYGAFSSPAYEHKVRRLAGTDPAVRFAGRYDSSLLPEILSDVDIVVIPSLWHENAPRTLVEAFQHGCPVIGSNVGGIADLVDHGVDGLLFEMGNETALAREMQKVINDPTLTQKLRNQIPQLLVGDVENESVFGAYREVMESTK